MPIFNVLNSNTLFFILNNIWKKVYNYGKMALSSSGYNLGDGIQTLAIEYIYQCMGILEENIIEIDICDINTYNGEYVLLPMYSVAIGIGFAKLPLPPRIIPLFISSHFAKNVLEEKEINYLRQYEPIGCRDEFSLQIMREHGIRAYIGGCITTVFPKRKPSICSEKVFLVDIPKSLETYIPKDILNRAERCTHMVSIPKCEMTTQDGKINYQKSKQMLKKYEKEAGLVIGSRLHALVPCMAMGIPVIGAFENISYRFSWLDKYIHLYSHEEFSNIDWNPEPVLYEEMKKRMLDFFCTQIQKAYQTYFECYNISEFYENRKKSRYGSYFWDKIVKMHQYMPDEFEYIIWGGGLIGTTVYEIMKQEFPKAKLMAVVDNYLKGTWHGCKIIKPDLLDKCMGKFFLLATYSGREECFNKMKEMGLKENADYIYVGTQNG